MKKDNNLASLFGKILLFVAAYYLASVNTDNPNKVVYYVCLVGVAGAAFVLTEEFSQRSKRRNKKK